ncbi:AMSH-like ubiquitin thioesterase 1 isoform X2 [Amaranthus tricolor]|uniref:AMSH-like ubiquitin thioesterase 1 isoform X2 n=1 Tax=Amaranthus tricolor TaxID=29722 RepID=UPI00259021B8|nr:AMSH-like ubiquitin thioesterase 1 isoform X2 [Amaranthus tricolor]
MRPPSCIDIAANAQKLDVDNRISLRIYYRIAYNILRQAAIFRNESNIIDLYVMLLRFSSLVSETIPSHREYAASPQSKKSSLKKQLLIALNELEALKPTVKQKVDQLEKTPVHEVIGQNYNAHAIENHSMSSSVQYPIKSQVLSNNQIVKASQNFPDGAYGGSISHQKVHMIPVEERFKRLSVALPRPTEESLLRHSILGPNGLYRQWQPPVSDKGVRYPSDIDIAPVEIPRLQQVMTIENGVDATKDDNTLTCGKPKLQPILEPSSDSQKPHDGMQPMITFDTSDVSDTVIIKQPSPPSVLAEVLDLIPTEPILVSEKQDTVDTPLKDNLVKPESPMELHISTNLMDTFLRLAKSNTKKNLETCGVLAGSLNNRKFYITALIIPKQESTSDTCQTTNEEEIFEVQDKRSLFPLGWIHTHPTQSCFMSSVDLHTHYSYQVMLPEAVAIVMAPRDRNSHGIFRLTTPGGMSVIRHCEQRGFHSHEQSTDGGPIYKQCTDVYMNPKLKFEIIDLR